MIDNYSKMEDLNSQSAYKKAKEILFGYVSKYRV
jgi:hypothetical protein